MWITYGIRLVEMAILDLMAILDSMAILDLFRGGCNRTEGST